MINESLLSNGVIIDIGCRGFEFANHFKGKTVFCVDPDKEVFGDYPNDKTENFNCLNLAISDKNGEGIYYRNGEMTHLVKEVWPANEHLHFKCKTITMEELYLRTGEDVDLLKLDCEGAEYIILGDGFRPVPKQITVEFHNHLYPELHALNYAKVLRNLSKDYNMVYSHATLIDNLFIRK